MNLVQINERLKDLPLQAVQQYANGMNPEIPPYLALAEIQRRQKMQQQMANAQGAAQGQQPSVKEQIEQKAGLMGLQQAQMQQQQAQMMQPRPGPVPAGIPQPEPQPQAQEMAGGGIARIPVRNDLYQFANGGIIAFQDGGWLDRLMRSNLTEAEKRRIARLEAAAEERREAPTRADEMRMRAMAEVGRQDPNVTQATLERLGMAPRQEAPEQPVVGGAPIARGYVPRRPVDQQPAGITALMAGARPPAARPAPLQPAPQQQMPQPQAPQMPPSTAPVEQTLEMPAPKDVISQVNQLAPAAMQEEAMQKRIADQRARAEAERRAYESSRPSGLDELIRVFGQAGQYKGLSGTGPAYTAMQQQKRAEDLAMERRQNELLTAIEGREYEGAKEVFGARTNQFDRILRANTEMFKERGANEREAKRQAHDLALEQVRMQNEKEIAKIKFDYDQKLRAMPTAEERLRNQAVADYQKMFPGTDRLTAQMILGFVGKGGERSASPGEQLRAVELINQLGGTTEDIQAGLGVARRVAGVNQPKVMTMADVKATAKARNMTEQQVMDVAKSKGYVIQ